MARSTIYYKETLKLPDLELEEQVISIFRRSRHNYGTRKIQMKLRKINIIASRRKIGQIMRKYHLVSNYIKNRPKQRHQSCNNDDLPNLLARNFHREVELDVVVSDLTYVRVAGTWCYVCLIVDLWNREIIGYAVGKRRLQN